PVKKGLYVLLDYLKENGYKLAVASSTSKRGVERNLKSAGVLEYFDAIICGDMVEKSKPEPEIYLKACEALGVEPAEALALEDSRNGLLSAYRAGMKVIMVPDLWEADEEVKAFLWNMCNDLEEVKVFLEKQ
ncbi:MAG: HAD-IA family hydrolase, partial [Lachnospiraceae bacterium]|nr:HAD-IA family hydrolase [Lachnospiraceae bacterium]